MIGKWRLSHQTINKISVGVSAHFKGKLYKNIDYIDMARTKQTSRTTRWSQGVCIGTLRTSSSIKLKKVQVHAIGFSTKVGISGRSCNHDVDNLGKYQGRLMHDPCDIVGLGKMAMKTH